MWLEFQRRIYALFSTHTFFQTTLPEIALFRFGSVIAFVTIWLRIFYRRRDLIHTHTHTHIYLYIYICFSFGEQAYPV
jgi:hypothetical protein